MIYVEYSSTTSYVIAKTSNSRIVLKECISTVDSNSRKWKKGMVNTQIIDNIEFHFVYTNYVDNPMDHLFSITRYRGSKK